MRQLPRISLGLALGKDLDASDLQYLILLIVTTRLKAQVN